MRVQIGKVGKSHGVDGAFFVELPSEDDRWWKVGATFFADGAPVEVRVSRRGSGGRPVIKLDREVARGASLEVERDELPATEEGEFYAFELTGLPVEEETGRALGTVTGVNPGVANDVLELDSGVLLPMIEDCIRTIDLEARRIVVAPGFAD